ncbi:hypothetical protein PWT90_04447 [Aphanocladium album]|nr:hypothetical protein PWT90_04447 [Aphanocladium album]
MQNLPPSRDSYTVGILVGAPYTESAPVRWVLDQEYENPNDLHETSGINYYFGSIAKYNVAIIEGPPAIPGLVTGSRIGNAAKRQFRNIRHYLLVGIGGGIPNLHPSENTADDDIHLGDVVVGCTGGSGAPCVVQHDAQRRQGHGSENIGATYDTSDDLRSAVRNFITRILSPGRYSNNEVVEQYLRLQRNREGAENYARPNRDTDKLFTAESRHHCIRCMGTEDSSSSECRCHRPRSRNPCSDCLARGMALVQRLDRNHEHPVFHAAQIASGSVLLQDARERELILGRFPRARCLEMEAAGAVADTHCLVIKGISDYCDEHRSYLWSDYAAAMAAVFARTFILSREFRRINVVAPVVTEPMEASSSTHPQLPMSSQPSSQISSPAMVLSPNSNGVTIASSPALGTTQPGGLRLNILPAVGQFDDVRECFDSLKAARTLTDEEFREQRTNNNLLGQNITDRYEWERTMIEEAEEMVRGRDELGALRLALCRARMDIEIERAKRQGAESQPNLENCLQHLARAEEIWRGASSLARAMTDSWNRDIMLDYDLAVIRAVKAEILGKRPATVGSLFRSLFRNEKVETKPSEEGVATAFDRLGQSLNALTSSGDCDATTVLYYETCLKIEKGRLLNPEDKPKVGSRSRLLLDPELKTRC